MKKSTRKDAGKKNTASFSRASGRMSTVKTVGLTLLAVLVLLIAIYMVSGALPSVFHYGADIITPVAEALHSIDSDSLGAQTSAQWLANTQRPITTPCPAGQSIRTVNADGSVVCQPTDSHWTASGADIISNNAGEVQIGAAGAGTLNVNTGTICLGGTCKTAWPAVGPGGSLLFTDTVAVGLLGQESRSVVCSDCGGACLCDKFGAGCNWFVGGSSAPGYVLLDDGRGALSLTVTEQTCCTGYCPGGVEQRRSLSFSYAHSCKAPFTPTGPINTWVQSSCSRLVFPPPASYASVSCLACKLTPPYSYEPPPYGFESGN